MFFKVKEINGMAYLYKIRSYRCKLSENPRNKSSYIGSVDEISKVLKRWRLKE